MADNDKLKWLTGSEPRAKILLSLLGGGKSLAGLVGSTGHLGSTVGHYIAPLVKDGMIAKEGGIYSLTGIGRLHAMLLHSTVSGLDAIEANREFWAGHDLSSIPDSLQAKIGMLSDCACIQDNGFVMKSLDNFLKEVAKARHVWGVSSVIAPGHVELVSGLLNSGAEVSLILTTSIIALIDPATIRFWKECGNFALYEASDDMKAAFTVTDDILSLGLYLPTGQYDTNQDLICKGSGAVTWGRELWEYYKQKAEAV